MAGWYLTMSIYSVYILYLFPSPSVQRTRTTNRTNLRTCLRTTDSVSLAEFV